MTILLAPLPVQSFKDANGNPLAGGQLYTYVAGTSTLQTTYTDATGTTPNTNPIILNSRGECNLWLTSGQAYKLLLQDSYGVLIWSVDQIASSAAASGANSDITSLLGLTTALSVAQGGTGGIDPVSARNGISASSSGFRNAIINGDQAIDNNGGAAVAVVAGAALAAATEMFYAACTGGNTSFQQVNGALSRKRLQFTGGAGNTSIILGTRSEAKNSQDLASAVATLSAKISSTSLTTIGWAAFYANTADTFGTLASPTRTAIASGSFTVSASEAVVSAPITLPAAATTGIEIVFTTGALGAGLTLTIGDIQLEPGAVSATAITFEKVETSQQLARTQRYFETGSIQVGGAYPTGGAGAITYGQIQFKTTKRVASGMAQLASSTSTNVSANAFAINTVGGCGVYATMGASAGNYLLNLDWSSNARLF